MGAKRKNRNVWGFFLLTFALAIPFWLIGAVSGQELLPGLPLASLAFVCPMIAAVSLVYRETGRVGATALLKRSFDFRRITAKGWYMPTLLLMPLVMVVSFGLMRLSGTPVPVPRLAALPTLLLGVGFFIGALGEELGWSGYATDPLQKRWGALPAAVALGAIWALYHYVGLAEAHRALAWIAWWSLGTVALRVIMVWLYNNTGRSVFAAALFHMTINVTWQLFPINGSYYDPLVTSSITAVIAVIVVVFWGPRTLTR